jgi:hypothetical protein
MDTFLNKTFEDNETIYNFTLNDTFLRTLLEQHLYGQTGINDHVTLVLVVLYVPVFLGGFIGNGLLTLVICARRRFRNITHLLLCNLACADLSGNHLLCHLVCRIKDSCLGYICLVRSGPFLSSPFV